MDVQILTAGIGEGYWYQWVLIGAMISIFYIFMIRPQYQKQKKHREFLKKLKRGDKVVTVGGIHGKIFSVQDTIAVIEVDSKGTKLTINQSAISGELNTGHTKTEENK